VERPAAASDTGKLVGIVYAVNTFGAILGSLLAALLLIGTLGTQTSQRLSIALAGLSALLLLALEMGGSGKQGLRRNAPAWLVAVAVAALLLGWSVAPVPGVLIGYGRFAATWVGYHGDFIYTGEGTHASLAVSETPDGVRRYHNAGKVQASSLPQDMRLQRMLGHLTTLVPEDPSSVLVIGFGAGVTAGAVSLDPRVEDLTIAEIERLVPRVVSTYFSQENFNVARNPKTTLVVDDARHFLLTTDQTFDAITSDPFDPWVKGAATLYTAEFFELMKQRLNPGGVVTIFVQLYESGLEAVKSEIATFVQAFPNAVVWANTVEGEGYDVVLMGQADPTRIDVEGLEQLLTRPEYLPIARSLEDAGFRSLEDLLATYIASGTDLQPWLTDGQITTDRNLRLGYLAGMALNRREADLIYREMASHGSFPEGLFDAPAERIERLREVITSEQLQARLMLGAF
jgi:spermidine synthase